MPYLTISNFKYGLDSRRSELSSVPGTLLRALNGHINQGGAFEKRKAFVKKFNKSRPTGTYGLEVTQWGLVVFGSVAPTTVDAQSQLVANTNIWTLPSYGVGIYYQRLMHPYSYYYSPNTTPKVDPAGTLQSDAVNAPKSDSAKTLQSDVVAVPQSDPAGALNSDAVADITAAPQMVDVVCSTSFGGKAWVVAKFADGNKFVFYDGTIIQSCFSGKKWTQWTSPAQGDVDVLLAPLGQRIINELGYASKYIPSGATPYQNAKLQVTSPVGVSYSVVAYPATTNNGTGVISAVQTSAATSASAGSTANASFVFAGAPSANAVVSSIKVNGVEILGSPVPYATSLGVWMTQIVAQINSQVTNPQYRATFDGVNSTINISSTATGSYQNNFAVVVTFDGTGFTINNSGVAYRLNVIVTSTWGGTLPNTLSNSTPSILLALPGGGYPPYSYAWVLTFSYDNPPTVFPNLNEAAISVLDSIKNYGVHPGTLVITVTDATGATASQTVIFSA